MAALIRDTITLADAIRVLEGAVTKAEEIGQPQVIAVCDAGGNLKAQYRMDGSNFGCVQVAANKAHSAVAFQCETKDLQAATRPDGPVFGLSDAHGGGVAVFPGGVPLLRNGYIIGGIGVSTGTIEQDQVVAEAGASSL